ncbi:MAG: type II toxin-antitoxin system Phd/YefM family antitoxin [Acidobacteria bacterium]|nr:type II toxin-antitoxin system Phd/YefM family antitoxin [Acidobacteriota bacterium]MYA45118.1 type II toxin-antitoxin system Phd/YefM family antitoxin [Acidobacteriota bacterium]MYI38262.1 type II toxin-antitoxin system Phd/YefM family antitoxin [Acidobacteriota bacterium]
MPVHSVLSVTDARERLAEIANRVRSSGERILLEERGTPVAALVPPSDLKALELFEDWFDGRDALDALADYRVAGGVRWEDVKRDLGQ